VPLADRVCFARMMNHVHRDILARAARRALAAIVIISTLPALASSQACDLVSNGRITPLVLIGSTADVALRDSALLGKCRGTLVRSPLSLSPGVDSSGPRLIAPVFMTVYNSTIPVTGNTGALWAGRGWNAHVVSGLRWEQPHVSIVVAPEIAASANRGFPILAPLDSARSQFASPFYAGLISADLPIRFGAFPFAFAGLGQSSIELHSDRFAGGFSTENLWWGPGIRNAIVMSNNAAGVPHLYVRSRVPLRTPVGDVEFRILLGQLTASRFFRPGDAGSRSLSAGVATLRVPFDTALTIGLARAVYGPVNGTLALPKHWADVLWRWNLSDRFSRSERPLSQIFSLFSQWSFPQNGFEVYGEWARISPPLSFEDLVVQPQKGQGFTVGFQSLRALSERSSVRIQAEATMLEQTPSTPGAVVPLFYTSHWADAGYTQRGQVIGASIGPGGSSQFAALDFIRPAWSSGLQVGRIQWNHEAYYRQPTGISYKHHDVSVFAGVRGSATVRAVALSGEFVATHRMNYLFQGADATAFDDFFDVKNLTAKLSVSPAATGISRRPQRR
jgi:hypothetical protein